MSGIIVTPRHGSSTRDILNEISEVLRKHRCVLGVQSNTAPPFILARIENPETNHCKVIAQIKTIAPTHQEYREVAWLPRKLRH